MKLIIGAAHFTTHLLLSIRVKLDQISIDMGGQMSQGQQKDNIRVKHILNVYISGIPYPE